MNIKLGARCCFYRFEDVFQTRFSIVKEKGKKRMSTKLSQTPCGRTREMLPLLRSTLAWLLSVLGVVFGL